MAKTQKPNAKPDKARDAASSGKADTKKRKPPRTDSRRETIESIVVAFILAFLFRTFEAEAFVIPTGSMAPTLYGRHKDVTCEKCGYRFAIGASDEVESPGLLIPGNLIEDAICPNCRYITPKEVVQKLPVFKGDRILVNKFPFEFGNPKRFDVVVFKYPEEPQTNYIKRLVGLPGDKLEIRQGDVYSETKDGVKILRKDDPNKQKQLQILVYDHDHPAEDLLKAGWPESWAPMKPDRGASPGWSRDANGWTADGRAFSLAPSADGRPRWIRYRHFVPSERDWKTVLDGGRPQHPLPELIRDFCGYNAYTGGQYGSYVDYGQYWVGDLTVNCNVNVLELETNPELVLELIEGFRTYRCRFNLESGECTIGHLRDEQPRGGNEEHVLGTATTKLKGTGKHRLTFANVDDRLSVWVDGKLIDFGVKEDGEPKTHYAPFAAVSGAYQAPTKADLAPVGIAAHGCGVTVSKLLVQRDIYYRAEHVATPDDEFHNRAGNTYEYVGEPIGPGQNILRDQAEFSELNNLKHDPEAWWKQFSGEQYGPNGEFIGYRHLRPARFPRLGPDEFFMMGDNSPRSKDSRLWPNENRPGEPRYAVKREALVGKAFFTYWPHGVPFLNDGRGFPVLYHKTVTGEPTDYPSFRVPFYPNFRRMHRIR
jgi:signal peptidase I